MQDRPQRALIYWCVFACIVFLTGSAWILHRIGDASGPNSRLENAVSLKESGESWGRNGARESSGWNGGNGQSGPHTQSWIDNGGQLTSETGELARWLEQGKPLLFSFGDDFDREYVFKPIDVTVEEFRISSGVDRIHPSTHRVFSGRELIAGGGQGNSASIALVNGALSMAVTVDGRDYLVETDYETGELYASMIGSGHDSHDEHHQHGNCDTHCSVIESDGIASISSSHLPDSTRIPVTLAMADASQAAQASTLSASIEDHPNLRNGALYDDSLKDLIVLWVSSKSQTGASAGLSAKAASYLSIAARVADVYERQLGFRYLLQELVLVASDSADEDPGDPPDGVYTYPDLEHFRGYLNTHRPQYSYQYGHAALWTLVEGTSGGVVGRAWMNNYGSSYYGHSVQELAYGWSVHTHEFGHNLGANHSDGGIMNAYLTSDESFFKFVSGQTYTAASEIYYNMSSPTKSYVFGDASLRHPEEVPFAVDDSVSIAAGVADQINVLDNDLTQVTNGAVNTLELVELGQVYPAQAGSVAIVGDQVEFDPADGFTGQAWFSYTLRGDVGNDGAGWMHSADVLVTVGGDSTPVDHNPQLTLQDDSLQSTFTSDVRFNPLLNDEADGHLWAGDVHVVLGPDDTTAEIYSGGAFRLDSASIVSGNGTLSFESRVMGRNGSPGSGYTGYLVYTPGEGDSDNVVIEYTAVDASGSTATAQVTIEQIPRIVVCSDLEYVSEEIGEVACLTFSRVGDIDLSQSELVTFNVGGTANSDGLRADYALAGQEDFNPATGAGSIRIPAGQRDVVLYVAVLDDGISESEESVDVDITGATSLPICSNNGCSTLFVNDSVVHYLETMESFTSDPETWNYWTNVLSGAGGEDDFDWVVNSGSTPTSSTGPSGDHTSGSGNYLLVEATGNRNSYAWLDSPLFSVDGKSGAEFSFWYHMYGSGMGTLAVDLYVDGSLAAQDIWSRSGQQSNNSNDWNEATIILDAWLPASTVQLRFRADVNTSGQSDMCLDDVSFVTSGDLPAAPSIVYDPVPHLGNEGSSVYLSVIPMGYPAPEIQWKKDGVPISGATGLAYHISSLDSSQAGLYEAYISNSEGVETSIAASVSLPGEQYLNWVDTNGLSGEASLLTADPDFDGISNLFEFAFGLDAMATGENCDLPGSSYTEESGNRYLEVQYRRRAGGSGTSGVNYTVDGITYSVETNSSLNPNTWQSGAGVITQVGAAVDNGDGTETVTIRRATPVGSGCAFIRVSVVSNGDGVPM
ncbi:MAG: M12 family metallo-peptidase [Puniceicoccaceae bacterium]